MRVLLATKSPDLGTALRLFLSERLIDVVDIVDDACGLSARAATAFADAVIVDSRVKEGLSAAMVADLHSGDERTAVVILSTSDDRSAASAMGADATAMLGDPPDALLSALERATAGTPRATPVWRAQADRRTNDA